jgi:DNA-binding NtrC family response regulator
VGKNIQRITKESLDLLRFYPWPGNIRELQNVIERSVIMCETKNFSVDKTWPSWLAQQPLVNEPKIPLDSPKNSPITKSLETQHGNFQ